MKRIIIIILYFPCVLFAQNKIVDSLKIEYKNAHHDTTRCQILNLLIANAEEDEWPVFAEQLLKLSSSSFKKEKSNTYLKNFYFNYMAIAYDNKGSIYDNQGDIPKALEYYHESLKIYESINDKDGIALLLNNIGYIYDNQKEYTKSLDYYFKSLKIREETADKQGIAIAYNNIGVVYQKQGKDLQARDFFEKSLKMHEELNDVLGTSRSSMNLGFIYSKQGNFEKALNYYYRSLAIQEKRHDDEGLAYSTSYIAKTMLLAGKINEALEYATRSLKIAKQLGYPENIMRASVVLKDVYKKQHNYKEAFEVYELEIKMRDSINNSITKKASLKKQYEYEYEKKAAADSVKHSEEQKVKNALLTAQQAQLKQEKTQRFALYGGLILVIIFLAFVFNRFRVTQKQKVIIEQQKVLVDEAFAQLEEKNKEVMDSIHYAKRIQTALMPNQMYIAKTLNRLSK